MAADRIIHVANAIVTALNDPSQVWSGQFTAKRGYGAAYTNPQLATLQVDVRHPAVQTEEESRSGSMDTYGMEIAIQKTVTPTDVPSIDTLVTLARGVARTFAVTSVFTVLDEDPALGPVQVSENLHMVFDPDKLAKGQFFSLISLAIVEFAANAGNLE